jgi:hypothetical protein
MIIKMQKTRFSPEYSIIEKVTNVTYRLKPRLYYTLGELKNAMHAFIKDVPQNSVWYQIDLPESAGGKANFPDGYKINEIFFHDKDDQLCGIAFDGEAFICTNRGDTIQVIRVGGAYPPPPIIENKIPPGFATLDEIPPRRASIRRPEAHP